MLGTIRCRLSTILGCRRMSQKELADKSGISPTTINRLYNETWEQIDKKTMAKICEALDIEIGKLFEFNDTSE